METRDKIFYAGAALVAAASTYIIAKRIVDKDESSDDEDELTVESPDFRMRVGPSSGVSKMDSDSFQKDATNLDPSLEGKLVEISDEYVHQKADQIKDLV